ASTSSWNEGGSGTATQSYGRASSSSRTRMAKSPEPWTIGKARTFGPILRKSSAVGRDFFMGSGCGVPLSGQNLGEVERESRQDVFPAERSGAIKYLRLPSGPVDLDLPRKRIDQPTESRPLSDV